MTRIPALFLAPAKSNVRNNFIELISDASWFGNLFEARVKITAWKKKYNEERPHSSLGYLTPGEFARRVAALRSPTAPRERQLAERKEEQVMSSGDLVSYDPVIS